MLAVGRGGDVGHRRIGHRALRQEVEGPVTFAGASHGLGEQHHGDRLLRPVGLRHRADADEGAGLDVGKLHRIDLGHREVGREGQLDAVAVALAQDHGGGRQRLHRAAQAHGGGLLGQGAAGEGQRGEGEEFTSIRHLQAPLNSSPCCTACSSASGAAGFTRCCAKPAACAFSTSAAVP